MAGEQQFGPSSTQRYVTMDDDQYEALLALLDSSGSNPIHTAHVQLTDAQIKARSNGSARTTIIAAPGANKVIEVHRAVLLARFADGAYTNLDEADAQAALYQGFYTIASKLVNGTFSGTQILTFSTIFGNANDSLVRMVPDQTITASRLVPSLASISDMENAALEFEIFNGAGLFTGGHADNTLDIIVWYSILDTLTGAVE